MEGTERDGEGWRGMKGDGEIWRDGGERWRGMERWRDGRMERDGRVKRRAKLISHFPRT
jgi:hypothetical protein